MAKNQALLDAAVAGLEAHFGEEIRIIGQGREHLFEVPSSGNKIRIYTKAFPNCALQMDAEGTSPDSPIKIEGQQDCFAFCAGKPGAIKCWLIPGDFAIAELITKSREYYAAHPNAPMKSSVRLLYFNDDTSKIGHGYAVKWSDYEITVPQGVAEDEAVPPQTDGALNLDATVRLCLSAQLAGRFVSYGEVAKASAVSWPKARYVIGHHLDRLMQLCEQRGWPLLAAIIVNEKSQATGELEPQALKGFIASARRLGHKVTDEKAFLREQQHRVFQWKGSVEIVGDQAQSIEQPVVTIIAPRGVTVKVLQQ